MMGEIGILNVGTGDTKLSFDPKNPAECIRAARIVKDMLRRGYALLVQIGTHPESGDPVYQRARDFDETKFEYIIADFDPVEAAKADREEPVAESTVGNEQTEAPQTESGESAPVRGSNKRGPKTKRIPAASTRGVSVARSAGG